MFDNQQRKEVYNDDNWNSLTASCYVRPGQWREKRLSMSRVMLLSVILSSTGSILHANFLEGRKREKPSRFKGVTRLNIELIYWAEKREKIKQIFSQIYSSTMDNRSHTSLVSNTRLKDKKWSELPRLFYWDDPNYPICFAEMIRITLNPFFDLKTWSTGSSL